MTPFYARDGITLYAGDCRDVLAGLPECSVDAIVTDPPYELGFMGKGWDGSGVAYDVATWTAALRVLKPGGHMLAFGAPRNYHRMACAIEDAGFDIRDCLQWLFGSGFPKSLDVSKALDKAAGAEREIVGEGSYSSRRPRAIAETNVPGAEYGFGVGHSLTVPATEAAQRWQGWGTALKPAYEPIVLARKPLIGTVAANVLQHGTGGLNIDGCRIEGVDYTQAEWSAKGASRTTGTTYGEHRPSDSALPSGRWPANVLLDDEAAHLLDAMSGESADGIAVNRNRGLERPMFVAGAPSQVLHEDYGHGGGGGASRFFYTAKASRAEREYGLDDLEPHTPGELTGRKDGAKGTSNPRAGSGRELPRGDKLESWVSEVLQAATQQDTARLLRRVTAEFGTAEDSEWSTMLSGKVSTAPSLKATSSTIETKTNSTTDQTISGSWIPSLISASIQDAILLAESGIGSARTAELLSRLMSSIGISLKPDGLAIDAAPVISQKLCALSAKGGLPSRVINAAAKRRNDHPT